MTATPPSQGKLLYHITHIDNMPSILEHGLLSRAEMLRQKFTFADIADPEIISGRIAYNQALSEYVLFHFYTKNPFDGAVCKKYGAENMAIISIARDNHLKDEFFIIPSHPLDRDTPEIYTYEDGFSRVQWDILDGKIGDRDYREPNIRKACMAECIVQHKIPPQDFLFVFIKDSSAEKRIQAMKNSEQIRLKVNPRMFP